MSGSRRRGPSEGLAAGPSPLYDADADVGILTDTRRHDVVLMYSLQMTSCVDYQWLSNQCEGMDVMLGADSDDQSQTSDQP
jgi:hypothetical protein